MSRIASVKNSFNAGELSPYALGRSDLDKYRNACEALTNWVPLLAGGLQKRPGTRYIGNCADQARPSRLVPFEFSLAQSFVLEFGNQTLRFYAQAPGGLAGVMLEGGPAAGWQKASGSVVADGTVSWTNRGFPQWTGLATYAIHAVILDPNGNIQEATTGGAAGSPLPVFATSLGATTVDGTVTWTNRGQPRWTGTGSGPAYALNQVVYTAYGIQQVTTAGFAGAVGSSIPYQIPTPYLSGGYNSVPGVTTDDLWDLKFAQTGDQVYIVHPNHPVTKLSRLSDSNWRLSAPALTAPPTFAWDQDISGGTISLTPGALTGLAVAFTASAPVFITGDIGKRIVIGAGRAIITALTGTTGTDGTTGATTYPIATCDIINDFASVAAAAAGIWLMHGSPQGYAGYGTNDTGNWSASRKFGPGVAQEIYVFDKYPAPGAPLPSQQDTFRTIDVGRYIILAGACGIIVSLHASSASRANVRNYSTITSTTTTSSGAIVAAAASGGAWSLEDPAYDAVHGYPRACCFFQQRLLLAGSAALSEQIFGSVTNDFENYAKGPNDDNGLSFGIAGSQNPIVCLAPYGGVLMAHTARAEHAIGAGTVPTLSGNTVPLAGALTPSNVTPLEQSRYGTNRIQPIRVDGDLIYVKRGAAAAGALSFDIQTSTYGTRNLTVLNEIIAAAGFKEMALQQYPTRGIWFTTNDGKLVELTYEKQNDVWGWSRHPSGIFGGTLAAGGDGVTTDSIQSACVISDPSALNDQLWLSCQRTLFGGGRTFTIELSDPSLYVDCGSQAVFGGGGVSQVSGLDYLIGRTVVGNGDGGVEAPALLATGTYLLGAGEKDINVQVGLPIKASALTVRLEVLGGGTIQGLIKRWARVWVRVYNAVGLIINGSRINFRLPDASLTVVPPFTGDVMLEANLLGDPDDADGRAGRVLIEHDQPLPCTILALFGTVSIGEN